MIRKEIHTSNASTLKEGIGDLLSQIKTKNILMLTFFADDSSIESYRLIERSLKHKLDHSLTFALIHQKPFDANFILEYYYVDVGVKLNYKELNGLRYGLAHFNNCDYLFLGGLKSELKKETIYEQANLIFDKIEAVFKKEAFEIDCIQRQWNYIPDIVEYDESSQNYQQFNDARSEFYAKATWKNGYPSATGIGVRNRDLLISLMAVKGDYKVSVLSNKEQVDAHIYSETVLENNEIGGGIKKSTPKFERGKVINGMIDISGTASITGEKTMFIGDVCRQTERTLHNIKLLLKQAGKNKGKQSMRVYVKRSDYFEDIKKVCDREYPEAQKNYVQADVCRDDLLVEIEMCQM